MQEKLNPLQKIYILMITFKKILLSNIFFIWIFFLIPVCNADNSTSISSSESTEKDLLFNLYETSILNPSNVDEYMKANNLQKNNYLLSCFSTRKQKIKTLLSEDDIKRADWCRKEAPMSYSSETCKDPYVELYNWFYSMENVLVLGEKWSDTNSGKEISEAKGAAKGCASGAVAGSVVPGIGNIIGCAVGGITGWFLWDEEKTAGYGDLLSCP